MDWDPLFLLPAATVVGVMRSPSVFPWGDWMHDAVAYPDADRSCYELARSSGDAMERLAYVLRAVEYEAHALDVERGKKMPLYMLDREPSRIPVSLDRAYRLRALRTFYERAGMGLADFDD